MNTKQTIRICYDLDPHSVCLDINKSVLTEEMAREINDFLSESEERLARCDGDIYRVVGRMFAFDLISYLLSIGGGTVNSDSSSVFVEAILKWKHEGYPDADQLGITIEDAYVAFPEESDMDDYEIDGATE